MNLVDRYLNNFTMYRVVLYGLLILVLYSWVASLLGLLSFPLFDLFLLLVVLASSCFISNIIFSKIFRAPVNAESSIITALILYFLLYPTSTVNDIYLYFAAGIIAMASKYFIAFRKKHIFNPAAFASFVLIFLSSGGIWWIATPIMLPAVLIIGLLIIRKIRKFSLFLSFIFSSLIFFLIQVFIKNLDLIDQIYTFFMSFPVIFFATVMLPEPLTLPPTKRRQVFYGIFTGILFSYQGHIGTFSITSETALLIGNIFSFILSPKARLKVRFIEKHKIAKDTLEFIFTKPENFYFKPGQYLEWTIPQLLTDSRGNRRYFTIASSPKDKFLKLGIKIDEKSSSFKKFMDKISNKREITASSLAGDFVMPKDVKKKLVFIAGGIGITPFRSMIAYLCDINEKRDVTLFYANKIEDEIAYKEQFDEAKLKMNLKIVYILTDEANVPTHWKGEKGRLNEEILNKYLKDLKEYQFYLSGPNAMVDNYKKLLLSLGVKRVSIHTDYFPGF